MATTSQLQEKSVVTPNKLESEDYVVKTMPRIANTFDLTATFALIFFFITNVATATQRGIGTFTYWLIGGRTSFLPAVIASARWAAMVPSAGTVYNCAQQAFAGSSGFFL